MIRFVFRCLATLVLAAAVIMAVLDATRSVAASQLVLTPLASSWEFASPRTFEAARDFVETHIHPMVWSLLADHLLSLPGFVVLLVVAFLLFALGRPPARRGPRFAAQI